MDTVVQVTIIICATIIALGILGGGDGYKTN